MKKFVNGKKYVFVFKKFKNSMRKMGINPISSERKLCKTKSEVLGFKCMPWFDKTNGLIFVFDESNKENTPTQATINGEVFHRKWCKEVK